MKKVILIIKSSEPKVFSEAQQYIPELQIDSEQGEHFEAATAMTYTNALQTQPTRVSSKILEAYVSANCVYIVDIILLFCDLQAEQPFRLDVLNNTTQFG